MSGRHHHPFTLALLLLLVPPLGGQGLREGSARSAGVSAERLARIEPAMQAIVAAGQAAGIETLVARSGVVVHHEAVGYADREMRRPLAPGAIYRVASMTKPVTSVAILILLEEGKLLLTDPVSRFIPAFRDARVLAGADRATNGDGGAAPMQPARRPITIDDLLTHRAGLVYAAFDRGPVGEMYRASGVYDGIGGTPPRTLAENIDLLARQPLKFQPGSAYAYSLATDVLGRVVEVASGQPLDEFFRRRIFEPLQMHDTGFEVSAAAASRVSALYEVEDGTLRRTRDQGRLRDVQYFSGGAGLYSTARDYLRFAQMLLNGGALDGTRILGRKTVALMMASHTRDLGEGVVAPGFGFGYGGAVRETVGGSPRPGSAGAFNWSGIFGTYFWIDPEEQLVAILMHQLVPRESRAADLFHALTYAAIED